MRKPTKKLCELCGDVFVTTANGARFCPSCAEFRRKYRGYSADQRRRKKLTGNQAIIEKWNIEAQRQGLTYGKLEGKQYAAKHVRVEIPPEKMEGEV